MNLSSLDVEYLCIPKSMSVGHMSSLYGFLGVLEYQDHVLQGLRTLRGL